AVEALVLIEHDLRDALETRDSADEIRAEQRVRRERRLLARVERLAALAPVEDLLRHVDAAELREQGGRVELPNLDAGEMRGELARFATQPRRAAESLGLRDAEQVRKDLDAAF